MGGLIMNDSYSFKDILFGLMNEYLLVQQQLDDLNKFINLEENNLEKVCFYLSDSYLDKIKIRCILYDRKNKLEKVLEKIRMQLGIFPNYKTSDIFKINGLYSMEKYFDIIDKTKKEEFNQSINHILNTDFVKNLRFIHYGVGYDDIPFLSLNTTYICWILNGYASLNFNPYKDNYINIHSFKGILTRDKIEGIFNSRFSKNRLPIYYQNIIDNSSCFDKPLDIVGDLGYSKTCDFEFMEESKRLVLRKR